MARRDHTFRERFAGLRAWLAAGWRQSTGWLARRRAPGGVVERTLIAAIPCDLVDTRTGAVLTSILVTRVERSTSRIQITGVPDPQGGHAKEIH